MTPEQFVYFMRGIVLDVPYDETPNTDLWDLVIHALDSVDNHKEESKDFDIEDWDKIYVPLFTSDGKFENLGEPSEEINTLDDLRAEDVPDGTPALPKIDVNKVDLEEIKKLFEKPTPLEPIYHHPIYPQPYYGPGYPYWWYNDKTFYVDPYRVQYTMNPGAYS